MKKSRILSMVAIIAAVLVSEAAEELTPMEWNEGDITVPSGSLLTVTESCTNTKMTIHGKYLLNASGCTHSIWGENQTASTINVGTADGDDSELKILKGTLSGLYVYWVKTTINLGSNTDGVASRAKMIAGSQQCTHTFAGINFCKSLQPGSDGVVDALTIDHYTCFQPSYYRNYNTHPVRISITNSYGSSAANWGFPAIKVFYGGSFFSLPTTGGDIIVRGCDGGKSSNAATAPIFFGSYSKTKCYLFNTDSNNQKAVLRTEGKTDVVVDPGELESGSDYYFFFNATNVVWGHTGDFVVQYYYNDNSYNGGIRTTVNNVLPYGKHMTGVIWLHSKSSAAGKYSIDLYGTTQRMNALNVDGGSFVTNKLTATTATLEFGYDDYDGSYIVNGPVADKNIVVRKVGSGTMTLKTKAAVANLDIRAGKVVVKTGTNFTLSSLKIAEGATLEVDGVTVTVAGNAAVFGTVTLKNGGQLVSSIGGDGDTSLTESPMVGIGTVNKVGSGTHTFYADSVAVTGDLHVAAGVVNFSSAAVADKWWRFTFKKVNGNNPGRLYFDTIQMTDSAGTRVDSTGKSLSYTSSEDKAKYGDYYSSLTNAPLDATEETLAENSVMSSDTRWELVTTGNFRFAPSALFCNDNYIGTYWNQATISNDYPSTHVTLTFRLKESAKSVYKYRLAPGYADHSMFPVVWTLESRTTGGEWKLRDTCNGGFIVPASATAFTEYRTLRGEVRSGAIGLIPTANVQVDSGATLDCSNVSGGQELKSLTVDMNSAGTLKGVRLSATGTLAIVNAASSRPLGDLPLTFVDSSAAEALNWQITVNGNVVKTLRLVWSDGKLALARTSAILLVL